MITQAGLTSPSRPLVAVLLGLLLLGSGSVHGQEQAHEGGRLVLTEAAVIALDADLGLEGVGGAEGGGIVIWAREPNHVVRFEPGLMSVRRWILPAALVPIALWAGAEILEVVTRDPPALHLVRTDDGRVERTTAFLDGVLLKAARGTEGWYLLFQSEEGKGVLRLSSGSYVDASASAGELTVGPDGRLWVTATRYPFSAETLWAGAGTQQALRPREHLLDSLRASAGQPDFATWVSLPLVALDRGYLQSIADLASDRRLIVAYTASGHVLSEVVIDAPLGLLLGATEGPRVYGVRRTNGLEIVEYHYRWGDATSDLGDGIKEAPE